MKLLLVSVVLAGCVDAYVAPHTHDHVCNSEVVMASKSPPSGWEVSSGTWGTDLDRDESTTLTGQAAVKFLSTGSGATILSPWIAVGGIDADPSAYIPERLGYSFYTRVKTDRANAGDNVTIKIYYYDKDRGLTSTSTIVNATTIATGKWQAYGEAKHMLDDIRWVRFEVIKASPAFNLWIDSAVAVKLPPSSVANSLGVAETIPTATWTKVGDLNDGGNLAGSTETYGQIGQIDVAIPGYYIVTAQAEFSTLGDGEYAAIRIAYTDFNGNAQTSDAAYFHASLSFTMSLVTSAVLPIDANSTITMEVYHATGGNETVTGHQLTAARIGD